MKRLFKFSSLQTALLILRNGLRVTQLDALNDPKEVRYSFDRTELLNAYKAMPRLDISQKMISALRLQGALINALGFTVPIRPDLLPDSLLRSYLQNPPPVTNALLSFVEGVFGKIRSNIGVISFSEELTNFVMWAHYGIDHAGCAIEFDVPDAMCFDADLALPDSFFGNAFKVKYKPELPVPNYDPQSVVDVYITKLDGWSYEKEWRIFLPFSDENCCFQTGEKINEFDIVVAKPLLMYLSRIYLGARISASTGEEFRSRCAELGFGIPVLQLRLDASGGLVVPG